MADPPQGGQDGGSGNGVGLKAKPAIATLRSTAAAVAPEYERVSNDRWLIVGGRECYRWSVDTLLATPFFFFFFFFFFFILSTSSD